MKNWVKIWTEISEAFDTPMRKRTEHQNDIVSYGFCGALGYFGFGVDDKYNLIHSLRPKIGLLGYWWPLDKKGNSYRATFAGLMAAMGNRGFEEFLKWCKEHR